MYSISFYSIKLFLYNIHGKKQYGFQWQSVAKQIATGISILATSLYKLLKATSCCDHSPSLWVSLLRKYFSQLILKLTFNLGGKLTNYLVTFFINRRIFYRQVQLFFCQIKYGNRIVMNKNQMLNPTIHGFIHTSLSIFLEIASPIIAKIVLPDQVSSHSATSLKL